MDIVVGRLKIKTVSVDTVFLVNYPPLKAGRLGFPWDFQGGIRDVSVDTPFVSSGKLKKVWRRV